MKKRKKKTNDAQLQLNFSKKVTKVAPWSTNAHVVNLKDFRASRSESTTRPTKEQRILNAFLKNAQRLDW